MITIRRGETEIQCSSEEDAKRILEHLEHLDSQKKDLFSPFFQLPKFGIQNPWSRDKFWKFVESLGEPQKEILKLLVRKHKVSDQELRSTVRVENNQQLAGLLSGISKQAGAHDVSARSVFTIENEMVDGEKKKSFKIAGEFMRRAEDMNWPTE